MKNLNSGRTASERRGNNLKRFEDFYIKRQSQNLALTFLCVPYPPVQETAQSSRTSTATDPFLFFFITLKTGVK